MHSPIDLRYRGGTVRRASAGRVPQQHTKRADGLLGARKCMPPPPGPPPGAEATAAPPPQKLLGGGAQPKPPTAPDWRSKLPATNAGATVLQVPAVSSTGRTQWQPSSSFMPPAELQPEPEPEPQSEPQPDPSLPDAAQVEDSDDDMFATFASNYHQQIKQVTPDVSPEKVECGDAAQNAAAAARDSRAAALTSGNSISRESGSDEDTASEDGRAESSPEMSEEEAKKIAEEEAAATARAIAEDDEEEAAVEAADALDTPVALGFAENCDDFPHELEPEYFPSKIGGHPAWLHPMGVPVDKNRCPHCAAPLTFLLQIYTGGPGRAFTHPGAFHRTLLLFTCRSSACHARKPPVRQHRHFFCPWLRNVLSDPNTCFAPPSVDLTACVCRILPRSGCGARNCPSTTGTTHRSLHSTAFTGHPLHSRNSPAQQRRQLQVG